VKAEWGAEPLTHNPLNEVTGGIWRFRWPAPEPGGADRTLVCKLVRPPGSAPGAPQRWKASDDLRSWNYWRRELDALATRLADQWCEPSLGMPEVVEMVERPDGTVELWCEDVAARTGSALTIGDLGRFAHLLGRGQGRVTAATGAAPVASPEWLSHDFIRSYGAAKAVDERVWDDDEAWAHPYVADTYRPLRPRLEAMHRDRAQWLALLAQLPRTLSHNDVWPNNLLARADGSFVLVDWSFVGDGALGEDPANLVPDACFDGLFPASDLPAIDRTVTDQFLAGVAASPWDGDPRLALLGMRAAAVKYHWLAPLGVRAAVGELRAYGGSAEFDPAHRYRERAVVLERLCDWLDEADRLANDLGL
jgi:hypothetical protein